MVSKRLAAIRQGDFDYRNDYRWRDSALISPQLFRALLAAEDQKFVDHHGFDLEAIRKAFDYNRRGQRVRGASTITQQTAKNLFLWPKRSWLRKGLESWFTVWMELLWPKARILEVYANVAEFGPGIYGAEAAAQRFFAKSAGALSAEQAALLAAVLPSPTRYRAQTPGPWLQRRRDFILRQMPSVRIPQPAS